MHPGQTKLIGAVAVGLVAVILTALATVPRASTPPPTPAEQAQNKCDAEVSDRYLPIMQPMLMDPSPTIESILNRRRVEERYCLELSGCTSLLNAPEKLAAMMRSTAFEVCLSNK